MTEGRRIVLFVLAGGTSAVINVGSRILFSQVVRYEIAVVLAYLVGMTIAYTLNKMFVFERSGRAVADEYVRFGIINLVSLAQVWIVSVGLVRVVFPAIGFTWYAETVAHVIGISVPAFTSYFGHKHFSFAKSR